MPLGIALKAAIYRALQKQRLSPSELARRLGVDEKVARRILDPYYQTTLRNLEKALEILGQRVAVVVLET